LLSTGGSCQQESQGGEDDKQTILHAGNHSVRQKKKDTPVCDARILVYWRGGNAGRCM